MKIKPYRGRRSFLLANKPDLGFPLPTWRDSNCNPSRFAAIQEFARRLQAAGIRAACGPVLSGALFVQAISDASTLKAGYLRKPGYAPERHRFNYLPLWDTLWVFVDDVLQTGRSIRRAARQIRRPPEAIVVFEVYGDYSIPRKWDGVPVLTLRGREKGRKA